MGKKKDKEAPPKKDKKTAPPAGQNTEDPQFKIPLFGICGLVSAIIFLPTTIIMIIGMMPTFVALIVDNTKKKSKVVTVGSLNLAGTTPFLLELWRQGHTVEASWEIIGDPKTVVVIYSLASVGYLLDWAMTGIVASFLYQKALLRRQDIKKRQYELIERWGEGVAGGVMPDPKGIKSEDELEEGE